ncbi:MAG: hypothetical protein RLZZ200_1671, partial [Pseudomonadota bacterium]
RLRSPLVLLCLDDYLAGRRIDLSAVQYLDPLQDSALPRVAVGASR